MPCEGMSSLWKYKKDGEIVMRVKRNVVRVKR
jgi:hypothetical protein